MEKNTPNRIHPLVAGAAVSVMLVSLTGVAAITGLLPNSHSNSAPGSAMPVATAVGAAATAASPAALVDTKSEEEAPAPKAKAAAPEKRSSAPRRTHTVAQSSVAQGPAICHNCGRVESVQAIQHAAQPSGVGMVAGAVLGGVLGNQVGGGNGRKIATVAGAVGGGYAGNEIEKNNRATTSYQVRVRMEDGEVRTFPYAQQPSWGAGDRVRVIDGHLAARG